MSNDTAWYYETNGKQRGPVNRDQLAALIEAEAVGPHTRVWNDGLDAWTVLRRTELRDLLGGEAIAPPPLPDEPAPIRPQPSGPVAVALAPTGTLKVWIEILFWPQLIFAVVFGYMLLSTEDLRQKGLIYDMGGAAPIATVLAFVGLAGIVVFLIWLYRISENARVLSGETPEITSGWAVGWFFVPIANLWMPYQAVVGIWRRFRDDDIGMDTIAGWWLMFWVSAIAEIAGAIMITERILFLGTVRGTLNFAGVASLLTAFGIYAAIEMVRGMEARQRQALAEQS